MDKRFKVILTFFQLPAPVTLSGVEVQHPAFVTLSGVEVQHPNLNWSISQNNAVRPKCGRVPFQQKHERL